MAVHRDPAGEESILINEEEVEDLAGEVRRGLSEKPRRLSSRFLYDEEGSRLFQAIMHLPEYYLTRAEFEIMTQYGTEMLARFGGGTEPFELIELGPGDGLKTKVLLGQFLTEGAAFDYVPVDIDGKMPDELTQALQARWPKLSVQPRADDYFQALETLMASSSRRKVVLFLGSNVGNFSPEETETFYQRLRQVLRPGDWVLTGFDLQKHPALIQAAYNDSQGLTRAFNLNLLRRLNRELGANFDLTAWDHYECYDPEAGEVRSYLVSRQRQRVTIPSLDLELLFEAGEFIHTERSRKFTHEGIRQLAEATGFEVKDTFLDCRHYFADVLFQVPGE